METIIKNIKKKVLYRTFLDVWTDARKIIHKPKDFKEFKKQLKGKKIQKVWRRGKNIIFNLSQDFSLLVHQKLTGHLLYGRWLLKNGKWQPADKDNKFLKDSVNTFLHLIFFLDNKKMLALSDLRKFAKVELWKTSDFENSEELKKLGPEPLAEGFNFKKFKQALLKKKGKIKQVLMNQEVIVGIGNIYADEILWEAKVHPLKEISNLKEGELKAIYKNMGNILKKAIKLRGTSISDFRDLAGSPGFFAKERKVYQKEGEKCSRCGTIIQRIKIGGRSSHFCPKCQK